MEGWRGRSEERRGQERGIDERVGWMGGWDGRREGREGGREEGEVHIPCICSAVSQWCYGSTPHERLVAPGQCTHNGRYSLPRISRMYHMLQSSDWCPEVKCSASGML